MAASLLAMIPWADLVANAPAAVDAASRLWSAVKNKKRPAKSPSATAALSTNTELISQVAKERFPSEETLDRIDALEGQMVTSAEAVEQLAAQNFQLVSSLQDALAKLSTELLDTRSEYERLSAQAAKDRVASLQSIESLESQLQDLNNTFAAAIQDAQTAHERLSAQAASDAASSVRRISSLEGQLAADRSAAQIMGSRMLKAEQQLSSLMNRLKVAASVAAVIVAPLLLAAVWAISRR